MFEKIKEIISTQLDISQDEISLDTKLQEDLKADSLEAVEIIMAIEDEFEIEINDDAFGKISTVGDICTYIHNQLN